MGTPAPRRPEPDDDDTDIETLLRERAKTIDADDAKSEDWKDVREAILKRRHSPAPHP